MSTLISKVLPTRRHARTAGLPPGAVVYRGPEQARPVRLSVMDFDVDTLAEWTTEAVADVAPLRTSPTVSWITVDGLHDTDLLGALGEHFGIDPLVLEDIAHTEQRPKVEAYEDYLFLTLKMIDLDDDAALRMEQVSLLLGPHYVISFLETPGDVFGPVRNRIRSARGRIRQQRPDYLAYALVDVIVDHYFVVLEHLSDTGEAIEDQILEEATPDAQEAINTLRRQLIGMRRAVWPVRELLGRLERLESPLVGAGLRPFLRDAYDHAVQAVDLVESLRDVVSSLTDLYMTAISNRMNEIMKVLTIIGTIFIPLTFIAGIYGMNFTHMPELDAPYGYPIVLAVMAAIAGSLLIYFRRRQWI